LLLPDNQIADNGVIKATSPPQSLFTSLSYLAPLSSRFSLTKASK
jgi:hypothetical protein